MGKKARIGALRRFLHSSPVTRWRASTGGRPISRTRWSRVSRRMPRRPSSMSLLSQACLRRARGSARRFQRTYTPPRRRSTHEPTRPRRWTRVSTATRRGGGCSAIAPSTVVAHPRHCRTRRAGHAARACAMARRPPRRARPRRRRSAARARRAHARACAPRARCAHRRPDSGSMSSTATRYGPCRARPRPQASTARPRRRCGRCRASPRRRCRQCRATCHTRPRSAQTSHGAPCPRRRRRHGTAPSSSPSTRHLRRRTHAATPRIRRRRAHAVSRPTRHRRTPRSASRFRRSTRAHAPHRSSSARRSTTKCFCRALRHEATGTARRLAYSGRRPASCAHRRDAARLGRSRARA